MGFTETGPIGRDELQSAFMMNYSPQSLVVRAPRCGAAAGVAGDRKPGGPGLGSSRPAGFAVGNADGQRRPDLSTP